MTTHPPLSRSPFPHKGRLINSGKDRENGKVFGPPRTSVPTGAKCSRQRNVGVDVPTAHGGVHKGSLREGAPA